ncbi:cytochrome P450 [Nocardioides dubius]|uniref:Cytochrome P450 n=1 Tax=Nocardioides dubius TaxID=317019 RepID=A0ABP4EHD3_9ACTN
MTVQSCPMRPEAIDTEFPWFPRPPIDLPEAYRWLQTNEPVRRVDLMGGQPGWLVTRYDDVRAVLADRRVSADSQHPGFPRFGAPMEDPSQRMFLRMDAPQHTVFRKLLVRNFSRREAAALEPRLEALVDEAIDQMLAAPDRQADFLSAIALRVPSTVLSWILGVHAEDREFFNAAADRALGATDLTNPDALADAIVAIGELREYIAGIARERAAQDDPGDDIIGQLVAAAKAGTITMADVENSGILFVIAGHDTTTSMAALGLHTLLGDRAQWEQVVADPSLVPGAVEELLRYLTVVHLVVLRVASEDVEVGGVTIPAGEAIIPLNFAANRDATRFADPDVFDIHRSENDHLAFGHGAHLCIGQTLARLELNVIFRRLAERVPTLRVTAPTEELPFKVYSGINGVSALPVAW